MNISLSSLILQKSKISSPFIHQGISFSNSFSHFNKMKISKISSLFYYGISDNRLITFNSNQFKFMLKKVIQINSFNLMNKNLTEHLFIKKPEIIIKGNVFSGIISESPGGAIFAESQNYIDFVDNKFFNISCSKKGGAILYSGTDILLLRNCFYNVSGFQNGICINGIGNSNYSYCSILLSHSFSNIPIDMSTIEISNTDSLNIAFTNFTCNTPHKDAGGFGFIKGTNSQTIFSHFQNNTGTNLLFIPFHQGMVNIKRSNFIRNKPNPPSQQLFYFSSVALIEKSFFKQNEAQFVTRILNGKKVVFFQCTSDEWGEAANGVEFSQVYIMKNHDHEISIYFSSENPCTEIVYSPLNQYLFVIVVSLVFNVLFFFYIFINEICLKKGKTSNKKRIRSRFGNQNGNGFQMTNL